MLIFGHVPSGMCLLGQSPNRETPYYCLRASLLFTEATSRIKAG